MFAFYIIRSILHSYSLGAILIKPAVLSMLLVEFPKSEDFELTISEEVFDVSFEEIFVDTTSEEADTVFDEDTLLEGFFMR